MAPLTYPAVMKWLRARKLTQTDLAMALGRDPSLVSRVIRGRTVSAPVWHQITEFMANPETYRAPSVRSRRLAREIQRAHRLLKRAGAS